MKTDTDSDDDINIDIGQKIRSEERRGCVEGTVDWT